MSLTREALTRQVADQTGLTALHVGPILDSLLDALAQSMAQGQDIEFRGFGSFRRRWRKGHPGRNPKTGEPYTIPGHYAIKFTASRHLTRKTNQRTA